MRKLEWKQKKDFFFQKLLLIEFNKFPKNIFLVLFSPVCLKFSLVGGFLFFFGCKCESLEVLFTMESCSEWLEMRKLSRLLLVSVFSIKVHPFWLRFCILKKLFSYILLPLVTRAIFKRTKQKEIQRLMYPLAPISFQILNKTWFCCYFKGKKVHH